MLTEFRRLRLEKGLRQVDVAEMTNIPQPRISDLERGIPPTKGETEALLKALASSDEKIRGQK